MQRDREPSGQMRIYPAFEMRPVTGRPYGGVEGTRLSGRANTLTEGNRLTGGIGKELRAGRAGTTRCRDRPALYSRRCLSSRILGLRPFGTAYLTVPPNMIKQPVATQWTPQQ